MCDVAEPAERVVRLVVLKYFEETNLQTRTHERGNLELQAETPQQDSRSNIQTVSKYLRPGKGWYSKYKVKLNHQIRGKTTERNSDLAGPISCLETLPFSPGWICKKDKYYHKADSRSVTAHIPHQTSLSLYKFATSHLDGCCYFWASLNFRDFPAKRFLLGTIFGRLQSSNRNIVRDAVTKNLI